MKVTLFLLSILSVVILAGCATIMAPPTPRVRNVVLPDPKTVPSAPYIHVSPNIKFLKSSEVREIMKRYTDVYYVPDDDKYFLPTKQNMDVIVPYLHKVFTKLGIHYIADATDCDDFARLKAELSQLILGQAYNVEASPMIFVIFVSQKKSWANVASGGKHALCVYACVNEDKNNQVEVYAWEPQNVNVVNIDQYPNKDSVFYIGRAIKKIYEK